MILSFKIEGLRTSLDADLFSRERPDRLRSRGGCDLRISPAAIDILQEAMELYATQCLAGAHPLATHRRRVGVDETDLRAYIFRSCR